MARYQLTREDRSIGGKAQSKEAKSKAGQRGYEVTMERHPWMFSYLKYAPGMRRFKKGKFDPWKNSR